MPRIRLAGGKACVAEYLGVVPYELALKLQQKLVQARAEAAVPDVLLLLQHPPVITIGRFRGEGDILAPPAALADESIPVFHTSRGGGTTFHGPGQLVGYPILDLRENGLGVRDYIWKLEAVIISLLGAFDVQGHRMPEYPGVWVGDRKVCSVGICVSRHVTMHGFALNVDNNLRHFGHIRPCQMDGRMMTSLAELLGHPVGIEPVADSLIRSFSEIFGFQCEKGGGRIRDMVRVLRA